MALELAVVGGKAVASGARLAGDAAMAVGEGLADTAKEGLMRAGDTFGDFGDSVQETAGDMERGIADMGDRIAGAFKSRRMQRIELSHKVCPEWLVACLSASGIISFFAVCGRTIFCCYWPLECCGALFAKCFNRLRRCCCPCANEFMYWTITIDRIAARHSVPSLGAGAGRPRPLEVGVRYSKLFGLGGFEAWKTVEAGQVAQPQELPPQELGGGVVHFQARLRDLPLGQGFFQPVLPASGAGTATRHGRLPFWIAKAPFRLDSRHVVERGWALDEICALKLGQWRKIFSTVVDADHPKGPEKTPDEAIKEASSYGKSQRVQFPATVQMLEFSGMQPGAAEWPPRLVLADRGQAAAEDAMAIEYWGVEEDLVLVLQLFLERRAVKQAKKIKRNAVATSWLESLGQRARAVRDMATSAAEDAGDMARATLRRITLIRSLVPTDPNSTFELSRTISIPIRPYHREAGSIEQAFTGDRHLLHAYTETMASNTSRGIVVHLRRCRVEVAPGRGPIRGKVKIAGFLVPREALLQTGHMQSLEPLREMSRVDVFRGDDPEWDPRGRRRGGSLRLTVPLRPNDTTVRLYLRPRLTWSESFGNLLGMLPGIGGALSGIVKWASGPKDDDGLFRGEVIFRFHPMIDGTHVSCEVAGHGQQVEVTRAEMTEPGTGIQNVEVPSPGTSDARCSYFVQLRLCASEGRPLTKPVTFPVHIAPHTFLGWLAAVIGSIVMISGFAGLAALSDPPWCLVAKIFKAIPATLTPDYMNITAPASLFNLSGMVYECRSPEVEVDYDKLHMAVDLTMSHVTKGFLLLALSLLLCCPFKLWSRRVRNPCACFCPKRLQEGRCFPFAYYSVIVLSTLTLPVWWFVMAWVVASRQPTRFGFLSLQMDETVFRSGLMRSFFIVAGSVVHFVAILLCCCFTMHEGPDGFWSARADPLELVLPEHVADDLGLSATPTDSPANWGILETLAPLSRHQAHRASAALRSTLLEVGARSSGARSRGRTHVLKNKKGGLHKALSLVARERCGEAAWRGQGGEVFLSEVVRLAGAAPRSFVTSGEFEKAFRMLSEGPRGVRGRDGRNVAKMSRRHFAALRRWSLRDKKHEEERSTEDSLAHVWAEERLYRIPFHEAWEAADDDEEEEYAVLREIKEFFRRSLGQDLPAEEAWRALFVDGPVAHLVLDWKLSTWGALEAFSKADAIETSEDDTEAWPCNLAIGVLLRADQRLDSHPALVGATLHIDVRLRYLGREVAQLGTRDTVLCKDVDGAYGKPPKKYNLVVRARPQPWQPFDQYCVSFDIRPANEADGNWTGQWRWHMSSILSHLRVGWQLLDQSKDVERGCVSRRKSQAAAAAATDSSGGRASRVAALLRRGSLTSEMELEMGAWPGPTPSTSSIWEEPVENDWLDAVQQHPYPRGEAEAKLLRWFCPSCATMVPVWWPVSDYQLVLDLLGDKREKNPQYDLLAVDITDIIHSFQEGERRRLREASELAAHHPMVEQNPEMMLTLLRKLRRKARQSAAVARLLKYHVLDGRDPRARGEYGATVEGLKSLLAHVNETLETMPSVQRKVKVKTWAAELLAETRRTQWGEDQRPLPAGPVLHRVFDVDAGWKARRTLGGKHNARDARPTSRRQKRRKEDAGPRVYKGDTPVASGWALDRMRVAMSYGLTLPDWKAREGEDAIAWLREVAKHTANITDPGLDSFADLVLEGERRIFLDADGQVHELAKSSGSLLAGTETSRPGEQEGLSAMELSRLLRQLQEKQEAALREHRKDGPDVFALTVPLRTKADVSHLQAAVSERKGPGLVELSEDGAVVPYGARFLYVESPVLAARQEDIALFRDRLDVKGGEELLPATGTVGVTQDLLLQVPDDRGLLSLHLLLLARVHGFQLSRQDAGEALCNIAGGRGEPAAELKALRCLVRGRFPHAAMFADLDLKCDRGHAMELRQAQGVMSLLLPKTFECNGCWQKITRADDYYCCSGVASTEVPEPVGKVRTEKSDRVAKKASKAETCTFQLCTDCAYRIHEFKERLAKLREEMSEAEASSDSDDPAKKKQVQKGALIAELAKEYMVDLTDADADFFAASASGDGKASSTGFQDRLQRFMPVSEALSCCCTDPPPKMKRYSWRKWAVKTRICDWCQEKVPYTSEQYGCSNCGRTLCLACALRQKAANTPLARRGSRNFDEDGTLD